MIDARFRARQQRPLGSGTGDRDLCELGLRRLTELLDLPLRRLVLGKVPTRFHPLLGIVVLDRHTAGQEQFFDHIAGFTTYKQYLHSDYSSRTMRVVVFLTPAGSSHCFEVPNAVGDVLFSYGLTSEEYLAIVMRYC